MKRSQMITLALMGAPLLLTACGQSGPMEKAFIYPDVQACKTDGKLTDEACQKEFDNAQQEHLKNAPQYTSLADCEADFGDARCESRTNSGSSVFLPMMAGFMAANMLSNLRAPYPDTQNCNAGVNNGNNCNTSTTSGFSSRYGSWRGQPLYESKDDTGSWRTADNRFVSRSSGESVVSHAATESPSVGRVSRGGFGKSASMHASSSSSFHSSGS
ncbi:MAG TPA: DUF1190 domain-containing protein [Pseudomonadales bacterium]|nr:DUF1190 domain-containing protein [Pseudomonadales bacterium]